MTNKMKMNNKNTNNEKKGICGKFILKNKMPFRTSTTSLFPFF